MTNAAQHADPTNVSVTMQRRARVLSIIVEDDGKGFDVEALVSECVRQGRFREVDPAASQSLYASVHGLILVFSFHDGMFSMACRHHG